MIPHINQQTDNNNDELIYNFQMPYISDNIDRKIKSVFRRENIKVRLCRKSNSLKSILKPCLQSEKQCIWQDCFTKTQNICFKRFVIYHIVCLPCGGDYIGSSDRFLHNRIREHTHTGVGSIIHTHLKNCGNGRAKINVKILRVETDLINARLGEALFQKRLLPSLNIRNEETIL